MVVLISNNSQNLNRIIPYRILLNASSATKELVERILPEQGSPSLRLGLENLEPVLGRHLNKAGEGAPIVGCHFSFPAEFLSCFDCVPVCIEGTSYFLATFLEGGSEKYYDVMHSYGHPFHTCTSQKGTMGMTLDDLFKFDSIISPSAQCDCSIASYPFFKY